MGDKIRRVTRLVRRVASVDCKDNDRPISLYNP